MAIWPASIPQDSLVDGFSATQVDGRLRTSMSEGPEKVRRRFTATPEHLTCSFLMSPSEVATFKTFFDTTLVGGSLEYDWIHPMTRLSIACRIKDMPTYVPTGLYWTVSFTVEVMP